MKKGFSIKDLFILVLVVGAFAFFAFPKYFFEMEKSRAAGAEAVLVSVLLAENEYYLRHKQYSEDWSLINPYLAVPGSLGMTRVSNASSGQTQFYVFVSRRGKPSADGFAFTLRTQEEGQLVTISAERSGGARYEYRLEKELPEGKTLCVPQSGRDDKICTWFTSYADSLTLMEVPVPAIAVEDETAGVSLGNPENQPL